MGFSIQASLYISPSLLMKIASPGSTSPVTSNPNVSKTVLSDAIM